MNTFCELEEVYRDINKAFNDLQNMRIKAIRGLIYLAIKVEYETVTLKGIGELLEVNDLERIGISINEYLSTAMHEAKEQLMEFIVFILTEKFLVCIHKDIRGH